MRPSLSYREGVWFGSFQHANLTVYVTVTGDAAGPEPGRAATLWQIVDGFEEVTRAIEAFAIAMGPESPVLFTRNNGECFRQRICGFTPGNLGFVGVRVEERAIVEFLTGLPDGYVSYWAMLEAGRPVDIQAYV
jgi:hypothetical protein